MPPGTSAVRAGQAYVSLFIKDGKFNASLTKAQRRLRGFSTAVNSIGLKMLGATAAFAAPFAAAIKAASGLEETMNKFNIVFGENAARVKEWGDTYADEIGRSKKQIADFLAGSQDLFVPLGFDANTAEQLSKQITSLAVDLASFNNMADDAVLRDLHAALTGSGEVMKKYGVIVSEAAVKQELLNTAIDPKVATDQQKVFARLSIIMRGTTAAQGDAERSAGSFANQMKALQGKVEDAAAAVGTALIPVVTPLVTRAAEAAKSFAQWAGDNKDLVLTVAKLVPVLGAAGVALVTLGTAARIASAALSSITLLASPFGVVVAAIVGLSAGVLWLRKATMATAELTHETDGLVEATKARHAQEASQLERLKELASAQSLTNEQFAEAEQISSELSSQYGDLGLTVDKVAKSLDVAADAQERLTQAQRIQTIEALNNQLMESNSNIQALKKEIEALSVGGSFFARLFDESGEQASKALNALTDEEKRFKEIEARLARLRAGLPEELGGEPKPEKPPAKIFDTSGDSALAKHARKIKQQQLFGGLPEAEVTSKANDVAKRFRDIFSKKLFGGLPDEAAKAAAERKEAFEKYKRDIRSQKLFGGLPDKLGKAAGSLPQIQGTFSAFAAARFGGNVTERLQKQTADATSKSASSLQRIERKITGPLVANNT